MNDRVTVQHIQGGSVPGGHWVIKDGDKPPFIPPMSDCNRLELRHTDIVADIGAYVGTYAIRCARFPVREVRAFEPTPFTADILRRTSLPNLTLHEAAVTGDERDSVQLAVSAGIGVTNSVALTKRKERLVTVPAVSYEQATRGATIVKIDVEGLEYTYPIVQPSLRGIIIDFHPIPGRDWKARAREMMADIRNAGFIPVREPTFESGWSVGGVWTREIDEPTDVYEPMMNGAECCGCAAKLIPTGDRALCPTCWSVWSGRHKTGLTAGALA